HTRSKRDWSSDVCSSDLMGRRRRRYTNNDSQDGHPNTMLAVFVFHDCHSRPSIRCSPGLGAFEEKPAKRLLRFPREPVTTNSKRSEERRVGKERRERQAR